MINSLSFTLQRLILQETKPVIKVSCILYVGHFVVNKVGVIEGSG